MRIFGRLKRSGDPVSGPFGRWSLNVVAPDGRLLVGWWPKLSGLKRFYLFPLLFVYSEMSVSELAQFRAEWAHFHRIAS